MARVGTYNLISDFQASDTDSGYARLDPYWIVAIYRLGQPLSFDRSKMASGSKDLSEGALLRAQKPLIITGDITHVSVSNHKSSHTKSLMFSLKQTNINYHTEILPDDWAFCWMVNNRDDYLSLLQRIDAGDPSKPCNRFGDGLKFIGRVDDVFKDIHISDPKQGTKVSSYSVKCTGFRELETQFFYDHSLASKDLLDQDIGQWLTRLGVQVEKIFGANAERGIDQDNVNRIIPTLLDLIVGQGPDPDSNIDVEGPRGDITATPTVQNQKRTDGVKSAEYAYLVPVSVGNVLGKAHSGDVMSYADILELVIGVQSYSNKDGYKVFVPDLNQDVKLNRHVTPFQMMGTFLPYMPDFANRPLWQVFQQYLNPTVNEMYTAIKVNPDGFLVPTITCRQIPFTTDAFVLPKDNQNDNGTTLPSVSAPASVVNASSQISNFHTTKFLDLPRWVIPATLVKGLHYGRSNATRCNFVHVYGQSSYLSDANVPIQAQMLNNPPVRDDIDIMRSGLRPYMATVECWVDDQVGRVPSQWISLVADWMIGSHLTFNGTIELYGVQAPIADGDNVEFDGIVYHVMSVNHTASITSEGDKTWSTHLEFCNGMRDTEDSGVPVGSTTQDVAAGKVPIYPGFKKSDGRFYDPGITEEQPPTTGGDTHRPARQSTVYADPASDPNQQQDSQSQLAGIKTHSISSLGDL
jgi:hypothetical protein